MQRDKATLSYDGRTQIDRAMELVSSCVEQRFVSVRSDQRAEPSRAKFAQVVDTQEGLGRLPASCRPRRCTRMWLGWCSPVICLIWTCEPCSI